MKSEGLGIGDGAAQDTAKEGREHADTIRGRDEYAGRQPEEGDAKRARGHFEPDLSRKHPRRGDRDGPSRCVQAGV